MLVTVLTTSYAMWAILGVAFFQFGVGIAEQRATPWEGFLRTLPLSGVQRLGGRVLRRRCKEVARMNGQGPERGHH